MIASVRVHNINSMNLIKIMLLCIGTKNTSYTRVKSTSKQCCNTCFFEFFFVSPLPFVFKFRSIQWLIVRSVHVMNTCCKARIHNGQVLIRESHVDNNIWSETFNQLNNLISIISIQLSRMNNCTASGQFIF
ncbi:hypothetical protein D3C76_1418240 [compost metagenome]